MPKRHIGTFPVPIDDFVNVRDWGAKGDNSADDTTAFQTAIDKLPSTGGVILVPEGLTGSADYNVTGGSLTVGGKTVFWLLNGTVNGSWTGAGSGLPGTVLNDSSGVTAFTDLSDVPAYSGNALLFLRLNAGETALEFAAGAAGLADIVDDLTPQLGGNLDVNGKSIVSVTAGNITIEPDTTGQILLNAATVTIEDDLTHAGDTDNKFTFGTDTQTFTTGGASRLDISDSGVRVGTGARVTTILDEDTMSSDSATALATQQSIKAYVDAAAGNTILHVQAQKTSGTDGGTFTTGAWRTREMTQVSNNISGASVAANQATLPAGTYDVDAWAVAFRCDGHMAKVYNTTGAADLLTGSSARSRNGTDTTPTMSVVKGRFVLGVQSVVELQHQCGTTRATDGLGVATSLGTEVYAEAIFRKVG